MHRTGISFVCSAIAAAWLMVSSGAALATTTSLNTGSLGAAANGVNADPVTFTTGVVTAGSDSAAVYNNTTGVNTTVPFLSALNPSTASPFSIEFWARPTASDNDDAPVANRVSAGNRSGWVFFQRDAATGWNFRMYNGSGSAVSTDLTGGTATLNAWSQVVATWNGSSAQLYVNGVPIAATNTGTGTYNPNTTIPLTVGTLADQTSPYAGAIDEVAFYGSALTATQVASHFTAVSSPAYFSLIRSDGALLQLSNNVPEPATIGLLGTAAVLVTLRRHRRRTA
ncbi:MAG: fibronectin type repeat, repeat and LamG-like domain protein [Phycisphaerales bacterium]|nr:fibronectin type repeat, repeat and LamG-like domain protein [Phycisphaerales bacterium]